MPPKWQPRICEYKYGEKSYWGVAIARTDEFTKIRNGTFASWGTIYHLANNSDVIFDDETNAKKALRDYPIVKSLYPDIMFG
jgi:hypothetical protein